MKKPPRNGNSNWAANKNNHSKYNKEEAEMQEKVIVKEFCESDFCALVNYNNERISIDYGEESISIPIHQLDTLSEFLFSIRYRV